MTELKRYDGVNYYELERKKICLWLESLSLFYPKKSRQEIIAMLLRSDFPDEYCYGREILEQEAGCR